MSIANEDTDQQELSFTAYRSANWYSHLGMQLEVSYTDKHSKKSIHVHSIKFLLGCQEYTIGKEVSLTNGLGKPRSLHAEE